MSMKRYYITWNEGYSACGRAQSVWLQTGYQSLERPMRQSATPGIAKLFRPRTMRKPSRPGTSMDAGSCGKTQQVVSCAIRKIVSARFMHYRYHESASETNQSMLNAPSHKFWISSTPPSAHQFCISHSLWRLFLSSGRRSLVLKSLVSIPGRIVLRTNDQPPSLLCPLVDRFNNINQLLFVLQHPVELVVVPCPEVTHHMLIAEEEHECDRIVEFVHLFEIGDLVEVADVEDGKIFDSVGDSWVFVSNAFEERRLKSWGMMVAYGRELHPGACSRRPNPDRSVSRPGAPLRT